MRQERLELDDAMSVSCMHVQVSEDEVWSGGNLESDVV